MCKVFIQLSMYGVFSLEFTLRLLYDSKNVTIKEENPLLLQWQSHFAPQNKED